MNTAAIADSALHTVNDDEVTPPGTPAPYATNTNPTALENAPAAADPVGLQRQDLDIFIHGFILMRSAATDAPAFELSDVPENVTDQVWACLDLDMNSDNTVVSALTTAARRALKPVHPAA